MTFPIGSKVKPTNVNMGDVIGSKVKPTNVNMGDVHGNSHVAR